MVAAAVCDDNLLSGLVAVKVVVCLLSHLLTGTVVTYVALCIAIVTLRFGKVWF